MQRILVVEDDLDIQELLKNFLQEAGYGMGMMDICMALLLIKNCLTIM